MPWYQAMVRSTSTPLEVGATEGCSAWSLMSANKPHSKELFASAYPTLATLKFELR